MERKVKIVLFIFLLMFSLDALYLTPALLATGKGYEQNIIHRFFIDKYGTNYLYFSYPLFIVILLAGLYTINFCLTKYNEEHKRNTSGVFYFILFFILIEIYVLTSNIYWLIKLT